MRAFFEEEKIFCFGVIPFDPAECRRPDFITRYGVAVEEIRSVVPFLIPYYVEDGTGNISLYARSCDYHAYVEGLFARLLPKLERKFGGRFLGYADKSPILENRAASRAGLGRIGDNFMLINDTYGTFVFIGEILSTVAPETLGYDGRPLAESVCPHCGACKRACPMVSEGEAECLSALTQKKGTLTPEETDYLRRHGSAWGCDLCQLACPFNAKVLAEGIETPIPFFHENRISVLTKELLADMDDETFRRRAFSWRGRAVPERNLDILSE